MRREYLSRFIRRLRNQFSLRPESLEKKIFLVPIAFSIILSFLGNTAFQIIQKKWGEPSPPEHRVLDDRPVSYFQDWSAEPLPFDMAPIRLFAFPDRRCPIDAYGAINDGKADNTQAIASAIDDCAEGGGGTVSVPPGKWVTGPIRLKSDIRLDIEEGAEILFSQNTSDYLPIVFSRYEGMEYYNYSSLIYANGCHDIALTGKGILNGRGDAWWQWKRWQLRSTKNLHAMGETGVRVENRRFGTQKDGLRPSFIQLINCTRIQLEGFTIKNGPMWTIHPIYSDTLLVKDVTVETDGPNNDGIVIDSSRNVLIDTVHLDTADDALVIKSGLDSDGRRVGKPSENIVIRNCSVGRGNGGVVIGSEISGDVRNVSVSHCIFDGTKRGVRMKSAPGRGGTVENIWMNDISMDHIQNEAIFLNMNYDSKNVVKTTKEFPTVFRNIFFKNIRCSGANSALSIIGSEESPIRNLSFSNIWIRSKSGVDARAVENVRFDHMDVRTENTPAIYLSDAKQIYFSHPAALPHSRVYAVIEGIRSDDIHFDDGYPSKGVLRKK